MGEVIFSVHAGVGHSVLYQMEGVGHVFSDHHILKYSGPPSPVLFDQSLKSNFAVSKHLGWLAVGVPADISRRVLSRTAKFYPR